MMRADRRGFTIIELLLAMSFISVLLLSITMLAIHAGKIYNRGVILRDVNQAGRDISDNLRRDFLQSDFKRIKYLRVPNNDANWETGRLCLGSYSYVWNNPAKLDAGGGAFRVSGKAINLVRIVDTYGTFCNSDTIVNTANESAVSHILSPIERGSGVIGVHRLTATRVRAAEVAGSRESLYRIQFTLGTSRMSEINSATCRPPTDNANNFEFCAINQFETIVRTNG